MSMNINFDETCPWEILSFLKMKWDQTRVKKIFDLHIFEKKEDELIIPKYKCVITKKDKWWEITPRENYFPFFHQVFWFLLQELKNIDFALNELDSILNKKESFLFPNWTIAKFIK